MPKRKLSDVASSTPSTAQPKSQNPRTEAEYAHLKLQTTRLKQKFEFGVTNLSRAIKAARGFERQKLGRRQKEISKPAKDDDENANAKTRNKNKAKSKLSPEENARRIEGEIGVLKTLDPTSTSQKYLFKQLSKTKRIAESPVFYRFKQSVSKKISLEGPKSTEEANVIARLFKSNPVKNVLPGIMDGLRGLFGLEEGGKKSGDGSGSAKKDAETARKVEKAELDVSGDESESGDERSVARHGLANEYMDSDMDGESDEEDYDQFNARLASDSEASDDDDDQPPSKSKPPQAQTHRRSMSISLSPEPSVSQSPPPKKSKSQPASKNPPTSTTFLPSLMMGGYWSGSEDSEADAEEADEQPKRKNRMGQQARRALWEKKFGTGANHVKTGANTTTKGGKKGSKNNRDSGWDLRKGATGDGDGAGDRQRKKFGTGSNAMAMVGESRIGRAGGEKKDKDKAKAQDSKPIHPSWEAAKKAKEQKAMAAFSGKKVVFD